MLSGLLVPTSCLLLLGRHDAMRRCARQPQQHRPTILDSYSYAIARRYRGRAQFHPVGRAP